MTTKKARNTCHVLPHDYLQVQSQTTVEESEERSAKDIAAENAKVKLAQTTETFKHSQEMYDKGTPKTYMDSK